TMAPDRIRMRVHERGVGETRACGTGTVAAAVATLHTAGTDAGSCTVEIPGGTVTVTLQSDGALLTGPAEFVAHGELDETWWAAQGPGPVGTVLGTKSFACAGCLVGPWAQDDGTGAG